MAGTLNLRGGDIEYNPVFFSYAIIELDRITLVLSVAQTTAAVKSHLDGVTLAPYADALATLRDRARAVVDANQKAKLWLPNGCSQALVNQIPTVRLQSLLATRSLRRTQPHSTHVISDASPALHLKAVKNATELEGMRQSHVSVAR